MHHVYDHITQVQQGPLAAIQAFAAQRTYALFLDLLQHALGQGFHMTTGSTAGDHHEIGDAGLAAHVDGGDVLAFHVFQGRDGDLDDFFVLHRVQLPQ
ncbi:hypothetical protein D3C72_2105870 [compost metagenome]